MGESSQVSYLLNPPNESAMKISSIVIDLTNADKTEAGKCEHFSIRGYVAGVRKTNLTKCWPFSTNVPSDSSDEQTYTLPPLSVPHFRRWNCDCCVGKITAEITAATENDLQQALPLNADDTQQEVAANISADTICQPVPCNREEVKDGEEKTILIISDDSESDEKVNLASSLGHENGLDQNLSQEIPKMTGAACEIIIPNDAPMPSSESPEIAGIVEETPLVKKLQRRPRKVRTITEIMLSSRDTTIAKESPDDPLHDAAVGVAVPPASIAVQQDKTRELEEQRKRKFSEDVERARMNERSSASEGHSQKKTHKRKGSSSKSQNPDSIVGRLESSAAARKESLTKSKKRSKGLQLGEGKVSPNTSNTGIGKTSGTQRNLELESDPVSPPFQFNNNASNGNELDLSLSNLFGSTTCIRRSNPQLEDGPAFSLTVQKDHYKDRKSRCTGNLTLASNPELNSLPPRGGQFHQGHIRSTNSVPFLNEKPNYSPLVGVGSYSRMQHLDTSGARNKGKTVEPERVPEHSVSDDIPMEIVELMAKNQYERCLPDGEDDRHLLQATNNARNTRSIDLNKAYENGSTNPFQEETSQIPISRGTTGEIAGYKQADGIHSGIGQLQQPYASTGFSGKFSGTGSNGQNAGHNCQWIGTPSNSRAAAASLTRPISPCVCRKNVPQECNEAAASYRSFIIPQRMMDQPNKMDVLPPSTNSNLRGNLEYPFGCRPSGMRSVDFHSNEAMPAMHLLSLMDAGVQSGRPVDTSKFLNRPSFLHDHHESREFQGYSKNTAPNRPNSLFGSGDLGKTGKSYAVPNTQKLAIGTSVSSSKQKPAVQISAPTARPQNTSLGLPESCMVNRNPADFSIAGSGNPYMIRGESLKFGKKHGFESKSGLYKRRRNMTSNR